MLPRLLAWLSLALLVGALARDASARSKPAGYDLDNTLFDTRYRTQAAVRAFTKGSRSADLKTAMRRAVRIGNIEHDGEATGRRLGMSEAHVAAFAKHWNRFFWTPKNFAFDRPIAKTIALAKKEQAAGKEAYYVSGRTRRATSATLAQLRAAGLPNADRAHLFLKPNIGERTLPFKLSTLKQLGVGSYMSDSSREATAVQTLGQKARWVKFPGDRSAAPVASHSLERIELR